MLPFIVRKVDKFYLLIGGLVFSTVISVIALFVGYQKFIPAIILVALKCIGLASWQVIIYMLVADTTEYGIYKSGTRATGITFSLQTFIAKLKNAVVNSFMLVKRLADIVFQLCLVVRLVFAFYITQDFTGVNYLPQQILCLADNGVKRLQKKAIYSLESNNKRSAYGKERLDRNSAGALQYFFCIPYELNAEKICVIV